MRCTCVMLLSSRLDIVFNLSAGAITDRRQPAKDVDPHFKSQLYVEHPGHRQSMFILPNGPSKPRKQAHDRHLISAVEGFEPTTS